MPALNTKAKYKIGPILCDELRVALKSVFARLTETTTSGGSNGSIRLLPRVVRGTNAGGGAAWAEVETTVVGGMDSEGAFGGHDVVGDRKGIGEAQARDGVFL